MRCTVDIYLSLHISILLTQENSTPWRGAVFPYFTICSACCTPFVPYSLAKHTLYRHLYRASVPCRDRSTHALYQHPCRDRSSPAPYQHPRRDRSVQALYQYPCRARSAHALYQHPRQNNACHDSRKCREQCAFQGISRLRHLSRQEVNRYRIEDRLRTAHHD